MVLKDDPLLFSSQLFLSLYRLRLITSLSFLWDTDRTCRRVTYSPDCCTTPVFCDKDIIGLERCNTIKSCWHHYTVTGTWVCRAYTQTHARTYVCADRWYCTFVVCTCAVKALCFFFYTIMHTIKYVAAINKNTNLHTHLHAYIHTSQKQWVHWLVWKCEWVRVCICAYVCVQGYPPLGEANYCIPPSYHHTHTLTQTLTQCLGGYSKPWRTCRKAWIVH